VANFLQPCHVRKPCNGTDRPSMCEQQDQSERSGGPAVQQQPTDYIAIRVLQTRPGILSPSHENKPCSESHERKSLNHRGRRVATRADVYPKENHSHNFRLGYHLSFVLPRGRLTQTIFLNRRDQAEYVIVGYALSEYPPKNDRAASDSRKGKARGSHSSPRAISGNRMPPSARNYSIS
jgi:hypothetical protein